MTGSAPVIESITEAGQRSGSWEDTTRQVRVHSASLFVADREVQESSRLHVVDLSSGGSGIAACETASDGGATSESGNGGELWGRLLAEINYISSLNTVMYDYKSLDETIRAEYDSVIIRKRQQGSLGDENVLRFGDSLDLINVPYIENHIPEEDTTSMSKYFCEWPVLVLATSMTSSSPGSASMPESSCGSVCEPRRRSYVLPLDPIDDVVYLMKAFRRELDKFLKETHVENHHDFSLFSAFHAMQLITTHGGDDEDESKSSSWIPSRLKELLNDTTSHGGGVLSVSSSSGYDEQSVAVDESLAELFGQEILTNPFCCYQLLRFICLSVKSGFRELVGHETDDTASFYDVLYSLERQLKDISICGRMGYRLSYSSIKYAALLIYGLTRDTPHTISHADLIRLTQYRRLECDVGTCFPSEQDRLLWIQPLEDFVSKALNTTPVMVSDVPQTELGTAFERLRQIGLSCTDDDSIWLRFNADVFFMNSVSHQTMKGGISKKSISNVWSVPCDSDPSTQWIALFASGFAFTVDLPSNLLEYLENGQLLCEDVRELFSEGYSTRCYVVGLDYKELDWQNHMERLKELYRLKNTWSKLELCAWLDRCLTVDSENIESLINKCLKSCGNGMTENVSLHLEMKKPTTS